jgi:hypothetical protein
MHRQAEARRDVAREPAQRRAASAVPGPRHDDLAALSTMLNAAPAVQRLAVMAGDVRQDRVARSGAKPIQAKGRGGLVTTPVVQLALGDYWRRMRDGFGGISAAAGVGAGVVGYGIAGAAMAANPVMWGIGAGLGAAALGSYLLGAPATGAGPAAHAGPLVHPGPPADDAAPPAPAAAPSWLDMDFGDDDDDEWTPGGAYHGRRQAIIGGAEPRTGLEDEAHQWNGAYTRQDVGGGHVSWRRGRGGQPFVQSRVGDYGGARVRVDYNDIASALDEGTDRQREDRGHALLNASLGAAANFAGWADRQRRAGMHLLGITQVAEEHASRTPGSALLARGALQGIADGTMTFTEAFSSGNGRYTPAHVGGTAEMREVGAGTRAPDDDLAGLSEGL